MARWIGIARGAGHREWMRGTVPQGPQGPTGPAGSNSPGLDLAIGVTSRSTSRWARGPHPLRRREGVPTPLETPEFLHRAELSRVRARQFGLLRSLAGFMGLAAGAALLIRLLLP